jgi:hypothetical protein
VLDCKGSLEIAASCQRVFQHGARAVFSS